jgi:DNA-binding GntR family transcriptional regulator
VTPVPSARRVVTDGELLSDRVRRRLTAAVLRGVLRPGEHLHDDDLTAWLGVSRTPVRTALEQLAELGLVETSANRYTRVVTPTPESHRAALDVYDALHAAVAQSVLPCLSDSDAAVLTRECGRIHALLDRDPGRRTAPGPGLWTLERLAAMGEITAFVSRRCANPILLTAIDEIDLRLAFSFVSLEVPVDIGAVRRCTVGATRAVGDRDPAAFAATMSAFLASCVV